MFDAKIWARCVAECRGDISQQEFANLTGIGRSTIAMYEAGKSKSRPTINTLYRISSVSSYGLARLFEAAGYEEKEIPSQDHPLILAVHDLLRKYGYANIDNADVELIKNVIDSILNNRIK